MEGFSVVDVLLWGCVWEISGSNLGRNVVMLKDGFRVLFSVIHATEFDVMVEVSVCDSGVSKPQENIVYSDEIKIFSTPHNIN